MYQFDLLIYVFIEDYKGCEGICQTWVEYLSNKLQILSRLSQYYICKVSIYCKLSCKRNHKRNRKKIIILQKSRIYFWDFLTLALKYSWYSLLDIFQLFLNLQMIHMYLLFYYKWDEIRNAWVWTLIFHFAPVIHALPTLLVIKAKG